MSVDKIRALAGANAAMLASARAQDDQLRRAAHGELSRVEARLEAISSGSAAASAAARDEYINLVTQRDQLRRATQY